MGKSKLYFCDLSENRALELNSILDEMKEQDLKEKKVSEAKIVYGGEFFYCRSVREVLTKPPVDESCGEACLDYSPRNGKSGCCKNYRNVYEPGEEYLLKIDGTLNKITL